jgi:hypothetical protein
MSFVHLALTFTFTEAKCFKIWQYVFDTSATRETTRTRSGTVRKRKRAGCEVTHNETLGGCRISEEVREGRKKHAERKEREREGSVVVTVSHFDGAPSPAPP